MKKGLPSGLHLILAAALVAFAWALGASAETGAITSLATRVVNNPPSGGSVALAPSGTVAAGELVTVMFSGWTDIDGDTPLSYQVLLDDVPVASPANNPEINFAAPAVAGSHLLKARVFDSLDAATEVPLTLEVGVEPIVTTLTPKKARFFRAVINPGNFPTVVTFVLNGLEAGVVNVAAGMETVTVSIPNVEVTPAMEYTVEALATNPAGSTPGGVRTILIPDLTIEKSIVFASGDPLPNGGDGTFLDIGIPGADDGIFTLAKSRASSGAREHTLIIRGDVVFQKGDAAPDVDGGQFATFEDPVSNGTAAFIGTLAGGAGGVKSGNDVGLWVRPGATPGSWSLLARKGDVAPGAGGATWGAFQRIALGTSSDLYWIATLNAGSKKTSALYGYRFGDHQPQLLFNSRRTVQVGLQQKTVASFSAFKAPARNGGNGRDAAVEATLLATFTDQSKAIVRVGLDGSLEVVAATGDAVESSPSEVWSLLGLPAVAGDGTIVFRGRTKALGLIESEGIFYFSNQVAVVARSGDPLPDNPATNFVKFGDPATNVQGDILFTATLSSKREALFWVPGGTTDLRLVATVGDEIQGVSGGSISAFKSVALFHSDVGGSGPVCLVTLSKGAGSALCYSDWNGTLRVLARTGDEIAVGASKKKFSKIEAFAPVKTSPTQSRFGVASPHAVFRAVFSDGSNAACAVDVP